MQDRTDLLRLFCFGQFSALWETVKATIKIEKLKPTHGYWTPTSQLQQCRMAC